MNEKSTKALEFDKILNKLSEFASSDEAKEQCLNLKPYTDVMYIESLIEETNAALSRIWKIGRPEFRGLFNVDDLLQRVKIGGSLLSSELLKIAKFLEMSAAVKQYARQSVNDEEDKDITYDALNGYFELLEPNSNLSSEIQRCIISDDEIADDASSELKHIRKNIGIVNNRIHDKLQSILNIGAKSYVQEAVVTMRNGRYCIPIKSSHRAEVRGMVHDQSSTGSTLFVEPEDVVRMNNELRQLQADEKKEIDKILQNLSLMVDESGEAIAKNHDVLVKLDFIFAKAAYGKSYRGVPAEFNSNRIINLKKARHPLLDSKTAVPIDIRVGDDFNMLIITGPNTGGKTVSLKCVGLLSMMGLSGLLIPADEGSSLYPFNEIYADIGDEQSIEQSLSTFSAHMVNIVQILKEANTESLCLFDELGAGTDPIEGAALAMAILESLHKKDIRTITTTHYSELKTYALSENGVENGGCEFDVETLSPTYRLLIGIPGKSNAFAISSKLGMSDDIIDKAKEHLSMEQERFEDVMIALDNSHKQLEKEKQEIEKYKKDIVILRKTYEERQEKLDKQRDRILEQASTQADEILKQAKEEVDEAIRELNRSGNDVRKMEERRHRLREKIKQNKDITNKKRDNRSNSNIDISKIKIGTAVRVISMNLDGTISSLPDNKGKLFVTLGIMRVQVGINDIEIIEEKPNKNTGASGLSVNIKGLKSKAYNISPELMLIGKRADEAEAMLDKYLDDAYLSGLASVRIVHGKGTGALRNMVHCNLKNKSFVKSYKLAEYGEGDAGVTIADFRG